MSEGGTVEGRPEQDLKSVYATLIGLGYTLTVHTEHNFCKSRSALQVGVKMVLCCHLLDLVMMHYQWVGIPPGLPSLEDEVVEQNAHNHMGRVQEDVRQLPWAAVDFWSKLTSWR